jgi:hypothetical protein
MRIAPLPAGTRDRTPAEAVEPTRSEFDRLWHLFSRAPSGNREGAVEDGRMLPVVVGLLVLGVVLAIFVHGVRARRTRQLAMLGMVPAGAAAGAFAWTALNPDVEIVLRIAQALTALSIGLAHAVLVSRVPLPAERVWLRMIYVPVGLWAGTLAALWLWTPGRSVGLEIALGVLAALTLTSWILLAIQSRERGFVVRGQDVTPSVRFACPRCGTRVDWPRGVAACTDCGLFVHLHWPADELQARHAADPAKAKALEAAPERSLRFACPACRQLDTWKVGDDKCTWCGLKLSMHWNVHVKQPAG